MKQPHTYNIVETTEPLAQISENKFAALDALESAGLITNPDKEQDYTPLDAPDDFLEKCLGVIVCDSDFVEKHLHLIDARAWRQRTEQTIVSAVLNHWREYGNHPDISAIRYQLSHLPHKEVLCASLDCAREEYIPGLLHQSKLVKHLQMQKVKALYSGTLDLLKSNKPGWLDNVTQYITSNLEAMQPKAAGKPFLNVMSDDFTDGESCEEIIPKFLPVGQSLIFGGKSKVGKSVIMHPLICSLTYGEEFLGEKPKRQVPIIYLDYEGRRTYFRNWLDRFRQNREMAPIANNLHYAGLSAHPKHGGSLPDVLTVQYLKERIKAFDEPGVIIVDTFRGAFINTPGIDPNIFENSTGAIGSILRPLTKFCHDSGWTLVILHHFNKQGKLSGATEFSAASDCVCMFDRDLESGSNECSFTMQGRFLDAPETRYAKFCGDHIEYLGTSSDVAKRTVAAKMAKKEQMAMVALERCHSELRNLLDTLKQQQPQRSKYSKEDLVQTAIECCGVSRYKADKWIRAIIRFELLSVETAKHGKKWYRTTNDTMKVMDERWSEMLGEFVTSPKESDDNGIDMSSY